MTISKRSSSLHTLCISFAGGAALVLSACGASANTAATTPEQAGADQAAGDVVPRQLDAASAGQIRQGLQLCLTAIEEPEAIAKSGGVERTFPSGTANPNGAKIYSLGQSPILIAIQPASWQKGLNVCSILATADSDTVELAVKQLSGGFADSKTDMPHGPWWNYEGVRIDNDYADNHVFSPEIFDEDAFMNGLNDIRVYKCGEDC